MDREQWRHGRTPTNPTTTQGDSIHNIRSIGMAMRAGDGENPRRITISFSSEEPCRRFFGMEILDHSAGAVNLERLNNVGVLLFNHDVDKVVGRVVRAWVGQERGMAEVEFDSDEEAERIFAKVKSGTLKTVSVRYRVDAWEEVEAGAVSTDGRHRGPCRVARQWTPLEVSIVSVPADATVGVGRSAWDARAAARDARLSVLERQIQINRNYCRR